MTDISRATKTARPAAGSVRELLHVAVPLVLSSGSLMLMNVVDRVFLTWYSEDALAAAMPAGLLHWTVVSVAMGTATYVNSFVAQYEGAGQKHRVAAAVWQGLYLAAAAGVLLLVFILPAALFFRSVGHGAEVATMETGYFRILCAGSFPMLLSATLACFYSGRGKTIVVMWVNIAASLINMTLDYFLIFGNGPFSEWGIVGAGLATVVANSVSAILYLIWLSRPSISREYSIWENRAFDRELFARLVRYGLPNGLMLLADFAGFTLFIFLIGRLGKTELAATNLAFNLNSLAFVPMLGIGTAVMTLVGQRIGDRQPELAVRTTWIAFALCGSYMAFFSLVYLFLPDLILFPYAAFANEVEFEEIRAIALPLLRFVVVYSLFDAMAIVFGSAVRGAGDTRFALWYSFLTGWLIMVLPTWLIVRWFDGNLFMVWTACTAFITVVGIGYLIRFQAGRWKSMRVIEDGAHLGHVVEEVMGDIPHVVPMLDET